ncbi:unnamed protein product [Heligmosomoides polygyrus]|uniref:Histone domain-containing protein n=1 Tax=Heligmosomoides polygyrus TaxID=6339 RepID=A0A183FHE5_HELPZ|nr:unnamed protein product [Heligmosomoides polygyrus]
MSKTSSATRKEAAPADRKRSRRRRSSYAIYIYRLLKGLYQDAGIKASSMRILDDFVGDIVERLSMEAARLARYDNRSTITPRDVLSASRLILPPELGKFANSEALRNINKFNATK